MLQSRFIINIPDEELSSIERICFQIEQAHWYYEDFVRDQNPALPSHPLKRFTALFFRHCPLLDSWAHDHEKAFQNFMEYKVRVPVCGAMILNETLDKVSYFVFFMSILDVILLMIGLASSRLESKCYLGIPTW